jgi:type II secretory pathway pseudopilin PulG
MCRPLHIRGDLTDAAPGQRCGKRTTVKTRTSGLTVIEILVVVSIIAILVGILVPALTMVKDSAKRVKQHAQFTAIDLGLASFRNDYGDYPPSEWFVPARGGLQNYCGAQKLAEALLGWDLLGFDPESMWRADGLAADALGRPIPNTVYAAPNTLDKRRQRYIELETANAFYLGDLFPNPLPLAPKTYVLCDVFEAPGRKVQRANGDIVSPGTPILYYKANPVSKTIFETNVALRVTTDARIYNARDNAPLVIQGRMADIMKGTRIPHRIDPSHPANSDPRYVVDPGDEFPYFYQWYIRDPKVQAKFWPYRPDTYLLISAGPDGWYGTEDDICNFGRR